MFYKIRDPGVIRWEYLVDTVFDAFEAKPLLHLWSNVLFYSTFGDSSWSIRLFDCARSTDLQTISDARVLAVYGDMIYLLRSNSISAHEAPTMEQVASVELLSSVVNNWVSGSEYSAYAEVHPYHETFRIHVYDSKTLRRCCVFELPFLLYRKEWWFTCQEGADFRFKLAIQDNVLILYFATRVDNDGLNPGLWKFSFDVRTGEKQQVLLDKKCSYGGIFAVVDNCFCTSEDRTAKLTRWLTRGREDIGPEFVGDQGAYGSIARISDYYLYLTHNGQCSTLRAHSISNPWSFHATKDIVEGEREEEVPAAFAANDGFVAVLMEMQTFSEEEEIEYEYKLKVARVAPHAFLNHDIDSESSDEDCDDDDSNGWTSAGTSASNE